MREVIKGSNNIIELLSEGKIKDAIDILLPYASKTDNTELVAKVEEIDRIYKSGLDFMVGGVTDPDREKVRNKILIDLIEITDRSREFMLSKSDDYIKTYVKSKIGKSSLKVSDRLESYRLISSLKSGVGVLENDMLVEEIFMSILISDAMEDDDMAAINELLLNNDVDLDVKSTIVSAVMLSNNRFFHKNKVLILIDNYNAYDAELSIRALFGLLFTFHIYGFRMSIYKDLKQGLDMLMSDSYFVSDLRIMMMTIIKTNDSKETTEKLEREILPEIKKISSTIIDKIETRDMLVEDINPSWLKDSGTNVYEKFDELSSMQKSGFDIFINAFAKLKNFPFFNKWSNWFMPYNERNSSILSINNEEMIKMASVIKNINIMCDSDKYSFVLNVLNMPKIQRDIIISTFDSESESIADEAKDEEMFNRTKVFFMTKYTQNVYRFMKLLKYKPGVIDIFKMKLDFFDKEIFAPLFDNEELKSLADYYFKIKNYPKALSIFLKLSENYYEDVTMFEKMGYCYQQQGDVVKAIEFYEKSMQTGHNHLWAAVRLAHCYKQLNQKYDALRVYLETLTSNPDDKTLIYELICIYMELDNHEKALQYAYKLEYFEPENSNVIRAIGWCKLVMGELDSSLQYFNRLIPNYNKTDMLNMGHIFLIKNNLSEAVPYYLSSIQMYADRSDDFFKAFQDDARYLIENGVKQTVMNDLVDYLKYYL